MIYTSDALEHVDTVALTRGGLLLMALMSGNDYDTTGVRGCGIRVAHGLARCGFGDTLLAAAENLSGLNFMNFLYSWRLDLCCELSTNSHGFLSRPFPVVASRIDTTFPKTDVLMLLVEPLTSWSAPSGILSGPSASANDNVPVLGQWPPREPNIQQIVQFCINHLGWSGEAVIQQRLHRNLWSGVCFRMLCSVRDTISYHCCSRVLTSAINTLCRLAEVCVVR